MLLQQTTSKTYYYIELSIDYFQGEINSENKNKFICNFTSNHLGDLFEKMVQTKEIDKYKQNDYGDAAKMSAYEKTISFLNKYSSKKNIYRYITHEGMNLLKEHSWPGNIRELTNVIERTCLLSSSEEIQTSLIKEVISEDRLFIDETEEDNLEIYFKKYLSKYFKNFDENLNVDNLHSSFISKIEKPLIESTLKLFRGNQIKASKCLGFNRNTLRTKINIYGIEVLKKRKL